MGWGGEGHGSWAQGPGGQGDLVAVSRSLHRARLTGSGARRREPDWWASLEPAWGAGGFPVGAARIWVLFCFDGVALSGSLSLLKHLVEACRFTRAVCRGVAEPALPRTGPAVPGMGGGERGLFG